MPRLSLLSGFCLMLCCLFGLYQTADAQVVNLPTIRVPTTIASANVFQTILSAVTTPQNRKSLTIQNNNTNTDNCWLDFGVGVTAGNATEAESILLAPGQAYTRFYPYVPSDEIEATCAGSNDTLRVDMQ